MAAKKDLIQLVKSMHPTLNEGEYVFTTVQDAIHIEGKHALCSFNPDYALKNLFRTETTSKQDVSLTYRNSP